MKDIVEYTGPENEADYLTWLAKEYPWSVKYPPNSLWKMKGKLVQVVGYCLMGDEPGLKIVPLPTPALYEDVVKSAKNIHARHLTERAT